MIYVFRRKVISKKQKGKPFLLFKSSSGPIESQGKLKCWFLSNFHLDQFGVSDLNGLPKVNKVRVLKYKLF